MSFVLDAKMKVLPRKRQELLRTLAAMGDRISSQEMGCLGYHFYQDWRDENLIILSLEWKTREKLDRYLKSGLYRVLIGAVEVLCEAPVTFKTSSNLKEGVLA